MCLPSVSMEKSNTSSETKPLLEQPCKFTTFTVSAGNRPMSIHLHVRTYMGYKI